MKKNKLFKIRINDQEYLDQIIKEHPNIKSGRKNYYGHYIRVLKNILLTKFFIENQSNANAMFYNKFNFLIKKKLIEINLDNKN